MIEMGIIVGVGLLVTMAKMSWTWRIRLLSNPIVMDVIIFLFLVLLHWGTFSGVMVATIGALVCSLVLSGGRKLYGYVSSGTYKRGMFDISQHLTSK